MLKQTTCCSNIFRIDVTVDFTCLNLLGFCYTSWTFMVLKFCNEECVITALKFNRWYPWIWICALGQSSTVMGNHLPNSINQVPAAQGFMQGMFYADPHMTRFHAVPRCDFDCIKLYWSIKHNQTQYYKILWETSEVSLKPILWILGRKRRPFSQDVGHRSKWVGQCGRLPTTLCQCEGLQLGWELPRATSVHQSEVWQIDVGEIGETQRLSMRKWNTLKYGPFLLGASLRIREP